MENPNAWATFASTISLAAISSRWPLASGVPQDGCRRRVAVATSRRFSTLSRSGRVAGTSVLEPLYGSLDLDIAALGAVAPGSLSATDPAEPGIVVRELRKWRTTAAATEVELRAGADISRRGVLMLDGPFLWIQPRRFAPTWFAGEWTSGVFPAHCRRHVLRGTYRAVTHAGTPNGRWSCQPQIGRKLLAREARSSHFVKRLQLNAIRYTARKLRRTLRSAAGPSSSQATFAILGVFCSSSGRVWCGRQRSPRGWHSSINFGAIVAAAAAGTCGRKASSAWSAT